MMTIYVLSDAPKTADWDELQKLASDRDWWRAQVETIKDKYKLKRSKRENK